MLRNISRRLVQQTTHHSTVSTARLVHLTMPVKAELEKENKDRRQNATVERVNEELAADKAALQWRIPSGEEPGDWNSKFKLFSNSEQTSDYMIQAQRPIDLSPSAIKKWWAKRKERMERFMQQYVPERIEILGAELAAAHFLLYRGGSVKFVGHSKWMRANDEREFNLPNRFDANYKVEGLRCNNMTLYYEGLENLRCLQYLKFLSFRNVKPFDDWCLDRVSGSQNPKLEVLDISGTQCTHNGLTCLYRIPTLKLLIVDDPKLSLQYELSCAMLEEALPYLKVVPSSTVHDYIEPK